MNSHTDTNKHITKNTNISLILSLVIPYQVSTLLLSIMYMDILIYKKMARTERMLRREAEVISNRLTLPTYSKSYIYKTNQGNESQ